MTPEARQASLKARYDTLTELVKLLTERNAARLIKSKDRENSYDFNEPDRYFEAKEIQEHCEKLIRQIPAL